MATIAETAERFFDECEAGHGWAKCGQYCHPGATFAAQADTLSDMGTLEAYTEWMKGLMQPLPDGVAEVRSFAVDESRNNVVVFGASGARTPGRAARSRRPGRAPRPTTST